jgi:3-oxoacyl-[acyl-carrier protein] reductase
MVRDNGVTLVTGSSRGIGRAVARRLAGPGARVVVNYRTDEAAAAAVVGDIERAGGQAVAVRADVADPAQLTALFDAAERLGPLSLVVSNVATARFGPLADATDDDFEVVMATNLRAGFVALRESARRVRDGGRIVVISSGVTLDYLPGAAVYAASKAAVEQLVRYLAWEVGPRGVTVNSVLPGGTRTDNVARLSPEFLREIVDGTPLRRLGEPEDIADVVAFLASHEGRWITGQSIPAAGGAFWN